MESGIGLTQGSWLQPVLQGRVRESWMSAGPVPLGRLHHADALTVSAASQRRRWRVGDQQAQAVPERLETATRARHQRTEGPWSTVR
mgnify:CR=1 FL=1